MKRAVAAVLLLGALRAGALPPALSELASQAPGPLPAAAPPPMPRASGIALDAHRHFTEYYDEPDSWDDAPIPELKDPARIAADMAASGVQHSFLLSPSYWMGSKDPNRWAINEELSAAAAARPDLFTGFCGVHLAWDDREDFTRRCLELPGMRGLKLNLFWHKHSLTSPFWRDRLDGVLRASPRLGAVLIHAALEGKSPRAARAEARELAALARRHPRLVVIVAHAARGRAEVLRELGGGPANLLTEISVFESYSPEAFAASLREFGTDRVLFGVDGPTSPTARAVEAFEKLPLSREDKDLILRENGRDLLARLRKRR